MYLPCYRSFKLPALGHSFGCQPLFRYAPARLGLSVCESVYQLGKKTECFSFNTNQYLENMHWFHWNSDYLGNTVLGLGKLNRIKSKLVNIFQHTLAKWICKLETIFKGLRFKSLSFSCEVWKYLWRPLVHNSSTLCYHVLVVLSDPLCFHSALNQLNLAPFSVNKWICRWVSYLHSNRLGVATPPGTQHQSSLMAHNTHHPSRSLGCTCNRSVGPGTCLFI